MILVEQKQNKNKLTPAQAIEHLHRVGELLEFYLGNSEDPKNKEFLRNNKRVEALILEMADDNYSARKNFKKKFFKMFQKRKEEIEQENKELKIELKQEKDKHE